MSKILGKYNCKRAYFTLREEGSLQIWDVRQPAAAVHASREELGIRCYPSIDDLGAADHIILGTVGGCVNVWDARRLAAPLGLATVSICASPC